MKIYLLKRLLLFFPTIFIILCINFLFIQFLPGGPVDQIMSEIKGHSSDNIKGISSDNNEVIITTNNGNVDFDEELKQKIAADFGFDKPAHIRFFEMMKSYLVFDFGYSYYRDEKVIDIILEKLPVSLSLGLWSTLIIYSISIPLGISKALRDGSRFDLATSFIVIIAYAIPAYLFALILILLLAGGSGLDLFPMKGIISDDWHEMSNFDKIIDYFWHMALPIASMTIAGFASLTMITKGAFVEEMGKTYVLMARAKNLSKRRILYGHIFRNAMLIIISGLPATLIAIFFAESLLIEVVFSLDGLGLLSYQSVIQRDYPVIFANLYIFSLIGLSLSIISDLSYHWVDPRINFNKNK